MKGRNEEHFDLGHVNNLNKYGAMLDKYATAIIEIVVNPPLCQKVAKYHPTIERARVGPYFLLSTKEASIWTGKNSLSGIYRSTIKRLDNR